MAKSLTAFSNRGWRIAVAILLALGCCAMLLPVPQVSSPGKDRSEPYPCMDRPCGCASAEQCWKKCCCFTNQQKVAWAELTGVQVPDYVLTAAGREKTQKTASGSASECAHCVAASAAAKSSKNVATDCHSVAVELRGVASEVDIVPVGLISVEDEPSSVGCDTKQTTFVAENAANQRKTAKDSASSYFCGIAALDCQGLTSLWQILSMTMLPDGVHSGIPGLDWQSMLPVFDVVVCSCDGPPPEPPPRIGVDGFLAIQA